MNTAGDLSGLSRDAGARWSEIGPLARLKQLGGLEFLRRVIDGTFPCPPISATLGFRFTEATPGKVVLSLDPHEGHYNLIGTVHGGVHATLLDTAMACSILSTLPPGQGFTTLELKVNYVRPLTGQTGIVNAEGRILHAGRTVATAEGRLCDSQGRLIAHGTTTCLLMPLA